MREELLVLKQSLVEVAAQRIGQVPPRHAPPFSDPDLPLHLQGYFGAFRTLSSRGGAGLPFPLSPVGRLLACLPFPLLALHRGGGGGELRLRPNCRWRGLPLDAPKVLLWLRLFLFLHHLLLGGLRFLLLRRLFLVFLRGFSVLFSLALGRELIRDFHELVHRRLQLLLPLHLLPHLRGHLAKLHLLRLELRL